MAKREVEVPVTEGSGNVFANLGLVDQPKVSALMKGRLANFSSELAITTPCGASWCGAANHCQGRIEEAVPPRSEPSERRKVES
jgi:hypothetical protein